jgi:Ribbon-helix-helix protein, copG family
MIKSIRVIPKKKRRRGRPATGRDPVTTMRLPDELRVSIDHWAAENKMSRSEAIRALIEQGLKK